MQFTESPQHPYVSAHMALRHSLFRHWQWAKVFGYLGIPNEEAVSLKPHNPITA
jgi:hypothetical protein